MMGITLGRFFAMFTRSRPAHGMLMDARSQAQDRTRHLKTGQFCAQDCPKRSILLLLAAESPDADCGRALRVQPLGPAMSDMTDHAAT